MNLFVILFAVVALLAMFIFWTGFRNWVGRQLNAIWTIVIALAPAIAAWLADAFRAIARIIGIYSIILGAISLFALVLIILALLINAPGFTAFAFVLAISMVLLAWLPAGIVLKVFRVNKTVVPGTMKTFIAWVAFVGFIGLVMPDVLSFRSIMGAALVAFILMGVTTKINALDKIVFPLVIVMCLTLAWKHFFPEDFRSTVRYAVSLGKRLNTTKDRGSINNETAAATTYAVILRDVNTLYDFSAKGKTLEEVPTPIEKQISKGTIVKISSHKQEVKEYDGQGFILIQLANAKGSFVLGEKHWVESEFVQLATPREITPKDNSLLPKHQVVNSQPAVQPVIQPQPEQPKPQPTPIQPPAPIASVKDSVFTKGTYFIDVKGETPFNIVIVPDKTGCARYRLWSETYNYDIVFPDEIVKGGSNATLRYREKPTFKLASKKGDKVKLMVS